MITASIRTGKSNLLTFSDFLLDLRGSQVRTRAEKKANHSMNFFPIQQDFMTGDVLGSSQRPPPETPKMYTNKISAVGPGDPLEARLPVENQ